MSVKNFAPRPAYQGAGQQAAAVNAPAVVHSTPAPAPAQLLRLPDGRAVATLAGDTLVAHRRGSLHRLRRPPAWAIDAGVLAEAERGGASLACIVDTEGGREYWATLAVLRRFGFLLNRGHGEQVALPLNHWRPTRAEALRLAEQVAAEAQLVLPGFGAAGEGGRWR